MKRLISSLMAVMLIAVVGTASAAEFIAPSKDGGKNVTIPQGQSHRNVYVAGANVNVNSDIGGDLFAAGGMVNLTGTVEQDFNAGGGTVNVNGRVNGDARIAGGNINVFQPIGGDLLLGGGNVSVGVGSTVAGDLVAGIGNANIDGPVNGKVMISGGEIVINSAIQGDVTVEASEGLTFGPGARVSGKITYKGPKEAVVQEGAQVSTIEFTKVTRNTGDKVKAFFTIGALIQIAAVFIVAWLLNRYRRQRVISVMELTSRSPLVSAGIGFVTLIITPIVVVLLLFTFVGYYLAILIAISYAFILAITCAIAAIYLGSLLMQWYKKNPTLEVDWKTILLGSVVFEVLTWIPFVGWFIVFVLFLMTFGSIVRILKPVKDQPPMV